MKVPSTKICNLCGAVVAEKSILFHTVKDYVTIRLDEVPTYVNHEDNTTASKLHYCWPCWSEIISSVFSKEGG